MPLIGTVQDDLLYGAGQDYDNTHVLALDRVTDPLLKKTPKLLPFGSTPRDMCHIPKGSNTECMGDIRERQNNGTENLGFPHTEVWCKSCGNLVIEMPG